MKNTNIENTVEAYIPWYSEDYSGPMLRNNKGKDYLKLTPQDIKAELEHYVVNQEEACRKIAVMMYHHLHGHRFVGLLAGPTGSGKSFIAESLKETFPDVVYIRDVSNVTCDGWKGDKKVATLFQNVHEPFAYNGKIHPLIFLDECDKLFSPKFTGHGENASESVQSEFLTVIHGGEVEITENNNSGKTSQDVKKTMNTKTMSFLFAGAFDKRARMIAEEESGPSIGFNASHRKVESYSREITIEDVRQAGCMSEMCGRIQKIINLNKFTEADFLGMLNTRDRGPVYEMEKEFNVPILISPAKKEELAHDAFSSGLGIRGMKNAIRDYIDELTWENCKAKKLEIV